MKKLSQLLAGLRSSTAGFTMIELLVVIAVIGVLAVAVLSSINPIEQINKGRDTRTRSDAAQLINAVDRYYAIHEMYPWNVTSGSYTAPAGLLGEPDEEFVFVGGSPGDWAWADVLVDTGEVKEGFTNRISQDDEIRAFKEGSTNATMYACFIPTSLAFKQEAMDNCNSGTTPVDGVDSSLDPCPDDTAATLDGLNYICLP